MIWPFSTISRLKEELEIERRRDNRLFDDYINAGEYLANSCKEVNYLRGLLRENGIEFEHKNIRDGW